MGLKRVLLVVAGMGIGPAMACAQGYATASRPFDFQAGVGYSSANANYEYVHNRINGFAAYADLDFRAHIGGEVEFHDVSDKNTTVSQKTYEVGARSEWQFGRIDPYGKLMYGRGTQNFPDNVAQLSYNLFAAGAGVDLVVATRVKVRVEYEYQDWQNAPGTGLSIKPQVVTIGIAYHLPAGWPGGRR